MPEAKPRRGNAIFLGAVALISILVLIFLAPFMECPMCRMEFDVDQAAQSAPSPRRYWFGRGCDFCWKGRISVFTRFLDPHSPFPGSRNTSP